jgi:predicted DNA-binding transcriptional regulator AlpA
MELIPTKEVCRRVGLSRTTLWELTRNGEFPRPVSITGKKRVGYVSSEVETWIKSRIAARDGEAA